jgi:hypothetical protein
MAALVTLHFVLHLKAVTAVMVKWEVVQEVVAVAQVRLVEVLLVVLLVLVVLVNPTQSQAHH